MPKYQVEVRESVDYTLLVEADDQEEAEELACEIWAESSHPTEDFQGCGQGIEVQSVARLADDTVSPAEPVPWPPESHWDNHPDWPYADWAYAVVNDETRQGYVDWVSSQIETNQETKQ